MTLRYTRKHDGMKNQVLKLPFQGRSEDFLLGGGGGRSDFLVKCSLLVDRLGHTSECYIEVQQKRGGGERVPCPPPPLATPLHLVVPRTTN